MRNTFYYCLAIMIIGVFCSCSGSPIQLSQKQILVAQSSSPTLDQEPATEETPAANPSKTRSFDELFLFQPTKYPQGNWEPQFLHYEDIYFDSQDGTKLHAWFCAAKAPVAVVLYLHGNGGNLSGRARLMEYLQKRQQASVLIFDYRGYARSEGQTTTLGAIQDAEAARAKLAQLAEVPEGEVVLMGRSLGGAIAIQLAATEKPRGLIVESSFSSLKAIAKQYFPKLAWLVPAKKLDSLSAIKKNSAPVLISHGSRDRVIPFQMGKNLFAAAAEPKKFVEIPGGDHNDRQSQEYYKILDQFLKSLPAQVQE